MIFVSQISAETTIQNINSTGKARTEIVQIDHKWLLVGRMKLTLHFLLYIRESLPHYSAPSVFVFCLLLFPQILPKDI